jgi:hypothetical protein
MARFELFSEVQVCITESHLDDKVSTQDILISGYLEPFRNDRNCFGGGVLIYIADYLHASRRYDLEFNNRELIWIATISKVIITPTCNFI